MLFSLKFVLAPSPNSAYVIVASIFSIFIFTCQLLTMVQLIKLFVFSTSTSLFSSLAYYTVCEAETPVASVLLISHYAFWRLQQHTQRSNCNNVQLNLFNGGRTEGLLLHGCHYDSSSEILLPCLSLLTVTT